jgi:hypothetical protein
MISRRKVLSSFGLVSAFGLLALPTIMSSDAEAQTAGMERRQDREGDRREDRRDARQDRRDQRRGTTTTGSAGSTTGTTGAATK